MEALPDGKYLHISGDEVPAIGILNFFCFLNRRYNLVLFINSLHFFNFMNDVCALITLLYQSAIVGDNASCVLVLILVLLEYF